MALRHNTIRNCLALLLSVTAAAPAFAQDHSARDTGLPPTPTNRIIGHWQAQVALGSCLGGPAFVNFVGFNTFHMGGTLSDTNNTNPALRSPGHGTWKYLGAGRYETRFQIFRFLPTGAYDGYADVLTTVDLDASARHTVSQVTASNYNPDGTFRQKLCGQSLGTRVSIP